MTNPLVSVIVPNYNHARYLEQRLDTVFNQTYQNFEVIILDDKSTDNSLEVIHRYKDNPHLSQIVVNEQNTGSPFKQWDKGINLAKGELIWIAESDDYNELTFLEELIKEWGKHKDVVVAFSNYVLFTDDWTSKAKERSSQIFSGVKYIKYRMARSNHLMNASGILFDKKVFSKIDKDFINYRNLGDYILWVRLLECGNVLKVNKNLTFFRQTPGSVTRICGQNGIAAKEDKVIFDYIETKIVLSWWQKYIASASKLEQFSVTNFKTSEIKEEIYALWDIKNKRKINRFLKWLIGSLERHANILI